MAEIINLSIIAVLLLLALNILYKIAKKALNFVYSSIGILKLQIIQIKNKLSKPKRTDIINVEPDPSDRYTPILIPIADIPDTPENQRQGYLVTIFDKVTKTAYNYMSFDEYGEAEKCLNAIKNTHFKYLLAGFFLNIRTQYENRRLHDGKNLAA